MKYSQIMLISLGLSASAVIVGCNAHQDDQAAALNLPLVPQGGPPSQADCADFSGNYQMNSDQFTLRQDGCSRVTKLDLQDGQETTIIADGVERQIGNVGDKKAFESAQLTANRFEVNTRLVSQRGDSTLVQSRYFFSQTPCDLQNPDGRSYLTLEIRQDNDPHPVDCQFWSKQ